MLKLTNKGFVLADSIIGLIIIVGIVLIPLLKKYLIIIIFLLLYDVLIYLFGNKFLNYLTFML